MFSFRPPRSSSPANQQRLRASTVSPDISRSSVFSAVPELAGLSTEEVDLLDAIIERAGPTATTFLTVFKAYNDILTDRGLDPHEVVYYGKLLKLGTLKGGSWREKWDAIKAQNGYGAEAEVTAGSTRTISKMSKWPARSDTVLDSRPGASAFLSDDVFSSGLRRSQVSETDEESVLEGLQTSPLSSTVFPSRQGLSPSELTGNSLGLEVNEDILRPSPALSSRTPFQRATARPWDYNTSEPITSTPPSYRVVPRDLSSRKLPPPASFKPVEQKNSAINEEDAWKKVKMIQDEREADRFRDERLVERCFDVWKEGFHWIATTNEQIDTARDNLLLRKFFQRWYQPTASRRALCARVDAFANRRCQQIFFSIWKQRLKRQVKEKLQIKWRQDMRMRIQLVRQKRDKRVLQQAWDNLRQSHRLTVADQYYDGQLLVRFFQHWKTILGKAYGKEAIADEMFRNRMENAVETYWDHWRSSAEIARIGKVITERVGLRVLGETLDIWYKRTRNLQISQAFYNVILAKKYIRSWKTARDRTRNLEFRVNKHIARRDGVLLRAAVRVWKAHERGKLLEKVKAFRLTKMVWAVWKARMDDQRILEDLALHFSVRLNASNVQSAFFSWRQVLSTHRNSYSMATRYFAQNTLRQSVLKWRLQLHKQLKMTKKARVAERFLALHNAWNHFKGKYWERIAIKKLQSSEQLRMKRVFEAWVSRSQRSRHQRFSERILRDQIRRRILSNFLAHWTNRVIALKVQELEVSQRNEAVILITTFKKWKNVRARHLEELGLMQSYQDIRKEENIRRIFAKWLATTRAARHRRIVLEQREEEIKIMTIAVAWDKWRERFQEERLRPMEHQLRVQNREALKYRAFATWFSKTQSLPAIHFNSNRVKTRYWKLWAGAMPRALQARKARELDKQAVLRNFLTKWLQVYRTKLSLKAVARARYFPAPGGASSRSFAPPLPYVPRNNASRNGLPRRAIRSPSPDEKGSDSTGAITALKVARLASHLAVPTRARSEASPTRTLIPGTRASSPARSTKSSVPAPWYMRDRSPLRSPAPPSSTGGPEGRHNLWQELRDVGRKS
ncbi:hypothetical protein GYMLUDRAFT_74171 [Collybiopsis luxurians FD-317 M1]|uniref:Sfi1 spindle body domain-containing protein n=1 Tax=Collybiopsis luxurians FD-317 M1 TaxID=944289 RepID=A0A0D0BVZ5_9AGAR|nr:hypothetical protein GYMLUDRAFT_74171 [Collybiopsis luxurians FD-317 M1]